MIIKFHTFVGQAGDLQAMLIGVSQSGQRVSKLYNRAWFPLFNLKQAKKKIMKEFEILTGCTPKEECECECE